MDDGVEGQAAEQLGRAVAEAIRHQSVRELVDREGHQDEDDNHQDRRRIEVETEHARTPRCRLGTGVS